jgi:hypothetical protein
MSQEIDHSAALLKLFSAFCGEVYYEKSEGELSKKKIENGKEFIFRSRPPHYVGTLGVFLRIA